MKGHQRRAAGRTTYFKLATWDPRSMAWKDGKRAFPSEAAARGAATQPGRYRVSRVDGAGRTDLEAFEVD